MTRGRRRIAVGLLLLTLAAVGVAIPFVGRRALVSALADRGVEADIHLGWPTAVLTDVRLARRGLDVHCDHVAATLDPAASFRDRTPVLASATAGTCSIDGALAGTGADDATPQGATAAASPFAQLPAREVTVQVVSVDVDVRGRAITGTARDLRVSPATEDVVGTWDGTAPVAWSSPFAIRRREGAWRLAADEPVTVRGWSVRAEELVADDGELAAAGVSAEGTVAFDELGFGVDAEAGAISVTLSRVAWADGQLQLEGLEADLPALTPAPESPRADATELSAASAETDAERTTPAASVDEPPPPLLTDALAQLSSAPPLVAAARARFTDLLGRVPFPVVLEGARFTGVPVCRVATITAARIGPDGLVADTHCGAWGLAVGVPADPGEAIDVRTDGLRLSELPGPATGRVSLQLSVEGDARTLTAAGSVRLDEAAVMHDALSPERVVLPETSGEMRAEVSLPEDGERATLSFRWSGRIADVPLDVDASAEPTDGTWQVDVDAGVSEETPCASMWAAVPAGMTPNLAGTGVAFSGEAAPRLRVSYRSGVPNSFDMRQRGFMGTCRIEDTGTAVDVAALNDDAFVHTVTEGVSLPLQVGPGTLDYVPLQALPSYVPALMFLSEEIAFFTNPGFSLMLMRRAVRINIREGRYVYGGSTVTQQLVKNLFFTRDKTLSRKLEEAIVVWAIEQELSKERILELYINCIEFAPDVFGIRAAARHYFDKEPSALTPLEAAFLAALKPAPWQGERHRMRGHSPATGWWHERLQVLLQRLVDEGPYIDQAEVDHYAPYIVPFPTSPRFAEVAYPVLGRPKGALGENLPTARERLGLTSGLRRRD